jgi:hypothetical protein
MEMPRQASGHAGLAPHDRRAQGTEFRGADAVGRRPAVKVILVENPKLAELTAEFCRKIPRSFPGSEETRMSPQSFRSRALECLHLAQVASDSQHKCLLLSMAETWSVLAQSAEQMERYVETRQVVGRPH